MNYRKLGNEYVFTFDENGKTFIVRCGIGPGSHHHSIDGDSLALFPDRSSGHKRIIAYLESLPK